MTDDPFDLARFVAAQDPVMPTVRRELEEGRKRTHWMWFVFPQLRGLGTSATAHRYGITGREEAAAYLDQPVLDRRLVECTALVNAIQDRSIEAVFGSPDDMKFRSCMTLFDAVRPGEAFGAALETWFAGTRDPRTLALLHPRA
jgi:uncharacterized protein (DUF1810 family)